MIVNRKTAEEACETLGWGKETLDSITAEGVNAQYRQAVRTAHPDGGGTMEAFVAVDRAKGLLMEWLKRPAQSPSPTQHGGGKCARCNGKGHLMSQRAFRAMRVQCPSCRGTGENDVEHEKGDFR